MGLRLREVIPRNEAAFEAVFCRPFVAAARIFRYIATLDNLAKNNELLCFTCGASCIVWRIRKRPDPAIFARDRKQTYQRGLETDDQPGSCHQCRRQKRIGRA
jgi:hypothetical protein